MPTFLMTLAAGMLLALATANPVLLAWRFVRLTCLIPFALATLAVVWRIGIGPENGDLTWWIGYTAVLCASASACAIFSAPWCSRAPRRFRVCLGLGGLLGLTSSWLSIHSEVSAPSTLVRIGAGDGPLERSETNSPVIQLQASPWIRGSLLFCGQAAGAMFLGSITVAWLLGHAYLTATAMTIGPLRHFSRLLNWAVAVRFVFVCASLFLGWWLSGLQRDTFVSALASAWLYLVLRLGVGLVGVAVFALMVASCVRLRSTQSATGILYFGSVFAYVGELAGRQLTLQWGWPL